MSTSLAVVVNQRDSYDWPEPLIEALHAGLPDGTPVVFIDGGAPPPVRRRLEAAAERWGFELLREEGFVGANRARRIGLQRIDAPFVLFLENDVRLEAGCLSRLLETARREGLEVVVPLLLEEAANGAQRIHLAGGGCRLSPSPAGPRLAVSHWLRHQPVDKAPIQPQPTALIEYHALLVRSAFVGLPPLLDPAIPSAPEHLDFSLAIQRLGARVWLEPRARAVFLPPSRISPQDRPLFLERWSERLHRQGIAHFCRTWGLAPDDPVLVSQRRWVRAHRGLARPRPWHRLLRLEVYGVLNRRLLAPLQERLDRFQA
jgi:hypothetical protein